MHEGVSTGKGDKDNGHTDGIEVGDSNRFLEISIVCNIFLMVFPVKHTRILSNYILNPIYLPHQ